MMKYLLVAGSLAALSVAAMAQDDAAAPAPTAASTWSFFTEDSGRTGALTKNAAGGQIVLKCDKAGRGEVHALIMSPEKIAVPTTRPVSRPIIFRYNDGPPRTENWGFFEQHAIALGKSTGDRALARFVGQLRNASKVEMRLDTGISRDVELEFDVTGSQDAIKKVYDGCKDNEPS